MATFGLSPVHIPLASVDVVDVTGIASTEGASTKSDGLAKWHVHTSTRVVTQLVSGVDITEAAFYPSANSRSRRIDRHILQQSSQAGRAIQGSLGTTQHL